ncbi:MAG: DUF5053 domain-containing protein [Bacteroidales bacterium]|nr:DUF5053 domain-containing protein [Bacteroidales bacterium]
MSAIMHQLSDILLYIKWGNISKDFFGFSRGWIYQRLNGYDGNGKPSEFTESQKETLRNALKELAHRIETAADNIK